MFEVEFRSMQAGSLNTVTLCPLSAIADMLASEACFESFFCKVIKQKLNRKPRDLK